MKACGRKKPRTLENQREGQCGHREGERESGEAGWRWGSGGRGQIGWWFGAWVRKERSTLRSTGGILTERGKRHDQVCILEGSFQLLRGEGAWGVRRGPCIPQVWVNSQAARWTRLDTIPGVVRIICGQLWARPPRGPRAPSSPRGLSQQLLGQGVLTRVGGRSQNQFLKGSRILLLRRCPWKTSQTPQRGLRKLSSPEQTRQKVREGQVGAGSVMEADLGGRAVGVAGAQAPSLRVSLCSARYRQSLICPPFQTKIPHPAQTTSLRRNTR